MKTIEESWITIQTRICPECHKPGWANVKKEDFEKFSNGMHVQNAFPYLGKDLREMFITGLHPDCWFRSLAHKFVDYGDGTCESCEEVNNHPYHNYWLPEG